jgi:hypothetical protein
MALIAVLLPETSRKPKNWLALDYLSSKVFFNNYSGYAKTLQLSWLIIAHFLKKPFLIYPLSF